MSDVKSTEQLVARLRVHVAHLLRRRGATLYDDQIADIATAAAEIERETTKRLQAEHERDCAVEKLAEVRTWRLIQNAPHPGVERVLLWFPELGYAVSGFNDAYSYRSGGWKATHWMPLPARPADDVEAQP